MVRSRGLMVMTQRIFWMSAKARARMGGTLVLPSQSQQAGARAWAGGWGGGGAALRECGECYEVGTCACHGARYHCTHCTQLRDLLAKGSVIF